MLVGSTPTGLSALHQQLIQTGLSTSNGSTEEPSHRLTAMRAFWTWQRYVSLLYAKQSYTMVAKSLDLARPRAGAWLEPSLPLYQALARVVEGHRQHTPHAAWDAFAEILDRLIRIASHELLHAGLTDADDQFLNGLDAALTSLTGGKDQPIVVDIHTNPASQEVVQEATGKARLVSRVGDRNKTARGARLTQCEFKHPMSDRLTDAKWREMLMASPHPCGQALAAAKEK